MTEDAAYDIIGKILMPAFSGWTEEITMYWVDNLVGLKDADAAMYAAHQLAKGSLDRHLPGFRALGQIYDVHARRRQEEQLQLDEGQFSKARIPSIREGIEIARKAYIEECKLQKREPNLAFFDSMTSNFDKEARKERERKRAAQPGAR